VTPEALDTLVSAIERELLSFHAENPKATGVATSALRDSVDRRLAPKAFDAVLEVAVARGVAVVDAGQVRHPKAAVSAMAAEQTAAETLLPLLERQGLAPETVSELAAETGTDVGIARKVLGRLASEGRIVRISSELHFSADAMAGARASLTAYLRAHPDGATASELRETLGVSRKYAIPLLEYFDAQGLTKRDGDVRVLRGA
jgi:selenocysteine-specific elongation factor